MRPHEPSEKEIEESRQAESSSATWYFIFKPSREQHPYERGYSI